MMLYHTTCLSKHPLLWAGARTACGKITVSGINNCLNYCEKYVVYTQFTNMAASRIIQHGGQRSETHAICHSAVTTIHRVKSIPYSWKIWSKVGYFIMKNDLGCLKYVRNITEKLSLVYSKLCPIFIHPFLHTDQLSKEKQT